MKVSNLSQGLCLVVRHNSTHCYVPSVCHVFTPKAAVKLSDTIWVSTARNTSDLLCVSELLHTHYYISYFSIVVMKHYEQGNLVKEKCIWAYGSRS